LTEIKYYEDKIVARLIGAVIKTPSLLDSSDLQRVNETDFANPMHRLTFFTISNLYHEGHKQITGELIYDYLSSRPKLLDGFEKNEGFDFVNTCVQNASDSSIKPSLERLKKMSLLRGLSNIGVDVSSVYDWDTKDPVKKEIQENYLNENSVKEIGSVVSDRIDRIMELAILNTEASSSTHASGGIRELKERLKQTPDFGSSLYDKMMNTMVRGARKGKFYLFSAPTGNGKSRRLLSNAANLAVDEIYDTKKCEWVENGVVEPSVFITTELDAEETQTMLLAFVSGVNEDKILEGNYTQEEEERVDKALDVIERSELWIEHIPDFSIGEIEAIARRNVRERGVNYIFFDYIHTSMKFLAEITSMTNGMKLREDQILFMLSSKLKDLANELDVFVQSATQISGDWQEAQEVNQSLLRGSKAIADRIDVGEIGLKTRAIDEPLVEAFEIAGYPRPNYVIYFYKMRRGKYAGTKLWCDADLGTTRIKGLFVTDSANNLIPMEGTDIRVVQNQEKLKKSKELMAKRQTRGQRSPIADEEKSAF